VIEFLEDGILLQQPAGCPDDVYRVMLGCWRHDPRERFAFHRIHRHLRELSDDGHAAGTTEHDDGHMADLGPPPPPPPSHPARAETTAWTAETPTSWWGPPGTTTGTRRTSDRHHRRRRRRNRLLTCTIRTTTLLNSSSSSNNNNNNTGSTALALYRHDWKLSMPLSRLVTLFEFIGAI